MGRLEKRIAAVEAQCAVKKHSLPPEQDAAFTRIFAALRAALPVTTPALIGRVSSKNPKVTEVFANPDHKCFDTLLYGVRDRIKASVMTEDDRRVLDTLPQEDLSIIGMTAQEIVELYAGVIDEYESPK